ncbi:terminase small subunit-like protein [Klebsiella aerogenes]|uniref:terminase small subunit-like protein n=1 Tax=Klebsiella aerogenes TaxID=548 RepID=UPI001F474EA6|nr:hypothetical protein [Klebsiella aerogenes]
MSGNQLPVAYNRQLGLNVYYALADGKSYGDIAKMEGMPDIETMLVWLDNEAEFSHLVSLASADKAMSLANEIKDIADNADQSNPAAVEKARLQCDVRMWLAGQLWPSKYGSCR